MRLALVGTGLTLYAAYYRNRRTQFHNLAVPLLHSYVLAEPDIADNWEVVPFQVAFDVEMDRFAEETVASVIASAPDVLGLTCYWWDLTAQMNLAERVKAVHPGTRVVLGGPAATNRGERLLHDCAAVDAVVRGEGEERLAELLRRDWRDLSGLPRVAWRDPDGVVRTNPGRERALRFDEIPSPWVNLDFTPAGQHAVMQFSRGCPFRCKYCDWRQGGSRLRHASFERIRDELAQVVRLPRRHQPFIVDSAINNYDHHLESVVRAVEEADPDRRL